MPTINEAAVLRFYVDAQEYSDRITAIEAQAASSIATHKTEVAAAIAQVNLTQSQTITALTLEVNTLKTNLTNSITATQTDLINRADRLAQEVTDITEQLTQDKATFTQEIQDALDFLKDDASVASALRTPRKIQGVDFDGTKDISLPTFTTQTDGLVPKRIGATADNYLREDGTWVVPTDTTYALLTKASAEDGTATAANTISAQVLKEAIQYHTPTVTNIVGNAATASKLATPVQINGVNFDGSQSIDIVISGGGGGSTSYADTAGKLANPVQIHGVNFDGSTGFDIPNFTASKSGVVPAAGADTTKYLRSDGTWQVPTNTAYTTITSAEVNTGTATTSKLVTAALLKQAVTAHTPLVTNITGNAGTATKLVTARKINGIDFDGTGDINLDVYSKNEVDTAISNATLTIPNATPTIPNATETIAGKAKIATTAIAQAGVNDTDILTAKKLRVALNASGDAPVSACRAWVCFNGKASPPEILSSLNISSVVKNATGDYTLNFTTPLENPNYAVSCGGAIGLIGDKYYPCVKALGSGDEPMLKTPTQLGIVCCTASATRAYLIDMSEIYVEVFC